MLSACGGIPSKTVTLVEDAGAQFQGKLVYEDPYSGILSITNGPEGESFTGRFTVVDRSAVSRSQGSVVVPTGTIVPGVGAASSLSSGAIDASGYWYATGSKGGTMKCNINVGLQGHGQGVCSHSNGHQYQIVL